MIVKNPYLTGKQNKGLYYENFLSGISTVPFKWIDKGRETKMEFAAGFVGIKQNHETKELRPEIGWSVLKYDD